MRRPFGRNRHKWRKISKFALKEQDKKGVVVDSAAGFRYLGSLLLPTALKLLTADLAHYVSSVC
jgi:hypothetical protein